MTTFYHLDGDVFRCAADLYRAYRAAHEFFPLAAKYCVQEDDGWHYWY